MFRIVLPLLFTCMAFGQTATTPAGKWLSNLKFFDNNNYNRLELEANGSKLSGKLGSNSFEGTFQDGKVTGTIKPLPKQIIRFEGRLIGDRIEGIAKGSNNGVDDRDFQWVAVRETPKPSAPKTHTFEPVKFEHFFSDAIPPVLHIFPGDTVKTWSVDAGGTDSKGVRRTSGGNPLTGPFYVEGAVPGDTLVLHFNRIRLNRNSAVSGDLIVNGALTPGYVESRKKADNYDSDWKLDLAGGFASLNKPTDKMKNYKVPLAPMLGCVGVAPGGGYRYRSGYLAGFGGNMDYNQLREGATVYLQVNTPGALLFMGDGHAAQGAGELTGDALETSMDIEFTVELHPGDAPSFPRMENAEYLMASGISGSIDDAFKAATTNLARWLQKTYSLSSEEVSSVLGTAMVYDIAEVVDPQVHVVAKVPKSVLKAFQ